VQLPRNSISAIYRSLMSGGLGGVGGARFCLCCQLTRSRNDSRFPSRDFSRSRSFVFPLLVFLARLFSRLFSALISEDRSSSKGPSTSAATSHDRQWLEFKLVDIALVRSGHPVGRLRFPSILLSDAFAPSLARARSKRASCTSLRGRVSRSSIFATPLCCSSCCDRFL